MRILFISHSNAQAGAPRALLNLVAALRQNNEIAVVLPSGRGYLAEELEKLGVRTFSEIPYRMSAYPRVINPFKLVGRMYDLLVGNRRAARYVGEVIDEFRPDIVHTNVGPLDIAPEPCLKRGIPHIWHIREYQGMETGLFFFPSRRRFDSLIRREGNYNIGITRGIASFYGFRECDRVIYDGVLPESYEPEAGAAAAPRYFLYVGRLERQKGIMTLLRAWRIFQNSHPEYSLKIVGSGALLYSRKCRRFAAKYLNAVEFCGSLPSADVYKLMSGSTAVVVPGTNEGFGFIVAEAMWHGALVIGMDSAGTGEQFEVGKATTGEDVGFRFSGVEELAERMSEVAESPSSFDRIRQNGRKSARLNFSIERNASEVEKYYKQVLLWQKSPKAAEG